MGTMPEVTRGGEEVGLYKKKCRPILPLFFVEYIAMRFVEYIAVKFVNYITRYFVRYIEMRIVE